MKPNREEFEEAIDDYAVSGATKWDKVNHSINELFDYIETKELLLNKIAKTLADNCCDDTGNAETIEKIEKLFYKEK